MSDVRERNDSFVVASHDGGHDANTAVQLRIRYIDSIEDVSTSGRLVNDMH